MLLCTVWSKVVGKRVLVLRIDASNWDAEIVFNVRQNAAEVVDEWKDFATVLVGGIARDISGLYAVIENARVLGDHQQRHAEAVGIAATLL